MEKFASVINTTSKNSAILSDKARIAKIFAKLSYQNPQPKTELNYTNTFTLLVAVVLSAQSTDKGVNKVTEPLFSVVQSPQQILNMGEERLRQYLRSLGLYNSKTKNLIKLSQKLINEFNGYVPNERAALESLPGVGQKTAGVVLNIAFGQPTIPVDTHVFRVARRLQLADSDSPEKMEEILLRRIPPKYQKNAHHWLILHGRYVCKARKPNCQSCAVNHLCYYPNKSNV